MRINELVNPNILAGKEPEHVIERNGLRLEASNLAPGTLSVGAYKGNKLLGYATFRADGDALYSLSTHVNPRYRKKGIGTMLYDFAKALGNTIVPSKNQTPDAKAFWKDKESW